MEVKKSEVISISTRARHTRLNTFTFICQITKFYMVFARLTKRIMDLQLAMRASQSCESFYCVAVANIFLLQTDVLFGETNKESVFVSREMGQRKRFAKRWRGNPEISEPVERFAIHHHSNRVWENPSQATSSSPQAGHCSTSHGGMSVLVCAIRMTWLYRGVRTSHWFLS